MTGTAINPLFRAVYLAQDGDRDVTLIIPWLSFKDQDLVYPNKIKFTVPSEQEDYVRKWLQERTAMESNFTIAFYPGKVCLFATHPSLTSNFMIPLEFLISCLFNGIIPFLKLRKNNLFV
jgi:hypothetical protein